MVRPPLLGLRGANPLAVRRYAPTVDCVYDDSLGDGVMLVLGNPSGPRVRLWNRADPWAEGLVKVRAQLTLAGDNESLTATAHGITIGVAEEHLTSFMDHLAADFAGWKNTRTWENLAKDLRINAKHISGGYVDLTWTLSSRPYSWTSNWSASVTVRIEAGEQMRKLAAATHRFLDPTEQH